MELELELELELHNFKKCPKSESGSESGNGIITSLYYTYHRWKSLGPWYPKPQTGTENISHNSRISGVDTSTNIHLLFVVLMVEVIDELRDPARVARPAVYVVKLPVGRTSSLPMIARWNVATESQVQVAKVTGGSPDVIEGEVVLRRTLGLYFGDGRETFRTENLNNGVFNSCRFPSTRSDNAGAWTLLGLIGAGDSEDVLGVV